MQRIITVVTIVLLGFIKVNAQDSTAQQLMGKYKFPQGSIVSEISVVFENGGLVMSSSVGSSALEKESDDVYIIVAYQGKAAFKRDANRKVIGVSINAMGYQLEGTKENESLLPSLYQLQKKLL